ncbi:MULTISPECIES: UvrD-helicase domain-containing protein [unclassified Isoptericola]|uniref:UvrD-helicase domain-containing protein n=1 Tax=unclassified Isoptericola TaxID=2623355 RepID=UPI0036645605
MTAPSASTTDVPIFDVTGDLPQGTTVLEASAGTGKTFTIAALAARYVAEGRAELRELLLVTFGHDATSELRDRVRERLVATQRALHGPDPASHPDPVVALLADVDPEELERRRYRLTSALSQLDSATITTTHGFCDATLKYLGIAADVDPAATFVNDIADLEREVVDDLYVRRFADAERAALTPALARAVGHEAVSKQGVTIEPAEPGGAPPSSVGTLRRDVAQATRDEVLRRKRAQQLMDYDDQLTLLRDTLVDPVHGATAAARVRSRYRVVMVDEFQDTDPVQWEILRTAFHGHRDMVLIGDPKQAIYAFRGADVVAYLEAREEASTFATLGTNWRSDGPLLHALGTVLEGTALGDGRIVVRAVASAHADPRSRGGAPLRLRRLTRGRSNGLPAGDARALVTADTAADIVARLGTDQVRDGDSWRPLEPRDVAVLVRTNGQAQAVRDALDGLGVPAVVSGKRSVFTTASARDWLTLLTALEQPGHHGRAAALALTPFVGWDAAHLAAADDAEHDRLADDVRRWSRLLSTRGVAALHEAITREGLAERLLRWSTGERELTDLRHVGQVLHTASVVEGLGPSSLTGWLRRRIRDAETDIDDERSRRLETDAAAVQVVTVHASKGLEFGVVYVPFAWNRYERDDPDVLSFHADDGTRVLHVGGPGSPGYKEAKERYLVEDRDEELRLLYVALTRARYQVVAHWAPTYKNSSRGALTRVLFGARGLDGAPAAEYPRQSQADETVRAALDALAARSGGTIAVEDVPATPSVERWRPPAQDEPSLAVAHLDRVPDATWRRASYSALTAAAHTGRPAGLSPAAPGAPAGAATGGVESEPEGGGVRDEPAEAAPTAVRPGGPATPGDVAAPGADLPSPMSGLPAGTGFGTLVHEVLEYADTAARDLDAELLARCAAAATTRVPGADPAELAAALGVVARTPLGPLAGGRTLADVAPRDRLAELEFELPLAGGDGDAGALDGGAAGGAAAEGATLSEIAALLGRYLGPDDAFAAYPAALAELAAADPGARPLRGYLTGSIDAVLRVPGDDGAPRFLVVDYKTNRLGAFDAPLTAYDYRPEATVEAMLHAHYPLQLVLYLVALHRYLAWRLPGYDPDVHLGGGLYLFVRGMCGPGTPTGPDGAPYGVVSWVPPRGLVPALSALLDGGDA